MKGSLEDDRKEVTSLIASFFEVGKNKDLTSLAKFHAPAQVFTKFDEHPPFTRQNSNEAFIYEQAAFANISDYDYKLGEMRIDFVGEVAVATFYLTYTGVFVNNYSFEGSTVGSRSRVSMVLARFGEDWKIIHAHFSPFPDISKKETLR